MWAASDILRLMGLLGVYALLFVAWFPFWAGNYQPEGKEGSKEQTATIRELMRSMIDPSANVLWNSVASSSQIGRSEQRSPKTPDEWHRLRRHANTLHRASTLLLVPGRRVAKPGEKSDNPAIELDPLQIEQMIRADMSMWNTLARDLQHSATRTIDAIDNRDIDELQLSGNALNAACEHCHQKYWYPDRLKQTNGSK
jgi:hypothetical protein